MPGGGVIGVDEGVGVAGVGEAGVWDGVGVGEEGGWDGVGVREGGTEGGTIVPELEVPVGDAVITAVDDAVTVGVGVAVGIGSFAFKTAGK